MKNNKMKICILSIYPRDKLFVEDIGTCYIAASVRKAGFETYHIAVSEKIIDYDYIIGLHPTVVAANVYDDTKNISYTILFQLKNKMNDVIFIVGGYTATYHCSEFLQEFIFVDYLVHGEGEMTFLELINAIDTKSSVENIKGIAYRENNKIIKNPIRPYIDDLDTLPFPSRDILVKHKFRFATVSTSRGCTRNCSFCNSRSFWKKYRGRSIENVISELQILKHEYGQYRISFADNSIEDPDGKGKRLLDLANAMIEKELNIYYYVKLRADIYKYLDIFKLNILKKSGLSAAFIGIESANNHELQNVYHKSLDVDTINASIKFFAQNEINIFIGFIMFNPYSTFKTLHDNINWLEKNNFCSFFYLLYIKAHLYAGTDLYNMARDDNLISSEGYCNYAHYKFVDERVEKMSLFLESVFRNLRQKRDVLRKLEFYKYDHNFITAQLLRYSERTGDSYISDLVNKFVAEKESALSEVNMMNSTMFRRIMDLAEKSWNFEKAEKILYECIDFTKLEGIHTKIANSRFIMNRKLVKWNGFLKELI